MHPHVVHREARQVFGAVLQLVGQAGAVGPALHRVAARPAVPALVEGGVIGFGSTARGAVTALNALIDGLAAPPASPEMVCGSMADEATRGRRASTLGRRLAAIRYLPRNGRVSGGSITVALP